MAAIGTAQCWGAGDYQSWTHRDVDAFESLRRKAGILFERKGKK
jgi:hypothetical protein